MKKYLLLLIFISATLTSCSLDSDAPTFYTEIVAIESVDLPQEFVFGDTYEIGITYNRPTGCYIFNDFFYNINENERTIAVINTVYTNIDCVQADEPMEVFFTFPVTSNSTYVFKFFQGKDESGDDQYYIVEVPVVE
ncbi:MAG: hypothetical protein ACPGUH_06440 [Winogradskyella sp.]